MNTVLNNHFITHAVKHTIKNYFSPRTSFDSVVPIFSQQQLNIYVSSYNNEKHLTANKVETESIKLSLYVAINNLFEIFVKLW